MKVRHVFSSQKRCWDTADIPVSLKITQKDLPEVLTLDGGTGQTRGQLIEGFGACFNELGWAALNAAEKTQKDAFLRELFSPDEGDFNYGRVPIGANDFSLEWYSCDEVDNDFALQHFTIERDKQYTIPFVREAQRYQKDFTVFASPWSPPTWMKTHKVYNFGRIRMEKAVLTAYAEYFVKFVQAYKAEHIDVSQVHVQNEPMADQKFPSCLWHGEDMLIFIRDYLGPAFEKAKLPTEIWLGTINGPFVDFMLPQSAPFYEHFDGFANTVLSDPKARSYIRGVGLQWGGKHVIQQLAAGYPEMRLMNTESECGDSKNSWEHMEYIFNQMWLYFKNGIERYTYWNIALEQDTSSSWGWRQNSLCTVQPKTGELTRQPEFYLLKHFSQFVKKGARLLATKGHWTANTLAFENPDGTLVLVCANCLNREREFAFAHQGTGFSAVLPAHTIHTFSIKL